MRDSVWRGRANAVRSHQGVLRLRDCTASTVDFELAPAHTPRSARTGAPPVRGKGACSHPMVRTTTRTFIPALIQADSGQTTEGRFHAPHDHVRHLSRQSQERSEALAEGSCARTMPTRARDSNARYPAAPAEPVAARRAARARARVRTRELDRAEAGARAAARRAARYSALARTADEYERLADDLVARVRLAATTPRSSG